MILQKVLFLIFINILSISYSIAQDNCININIDSSILTIDKIHHKIIIQDSDILEEMYDNKSFEKICHKEYLEIICTMNNGNEYFIENQIYTKEKGVYFQTCLYFIYSNRNKYELYGALGSGKNLTDIFFNVKSNKMLLSETSDIQTNEITKPYFEKLMFSNRHNIKVLNLLALPLILGIEQIVEDNIKTANNLAFYLYQNKSYNNSINLLRQTLLKFPNNTESLLRLGDNYWTIGKQIVAKKCYEKYLSLVATQNKCKKNLKRVQGRVNNCKS